MATFRSKPATWAGLLLGFLLTVFVIVFLYVGFMFVSWGKTAVVAVPEMPALPLPRLMRAAPVESSSPTDSGQALLPQQAGAEPQAADNAAPGPVERRVTVLIMGVDNRPDEKVETTRTDTMIVLTINPATGATGMLSIPRDMLISVPALNGRQAKINTVHVLGYLNKYPGGGPTLLKDTISGMIGYPIDYYVRINFDGFRQIIDLIGGIDIDVPKDIHDPLYPDNNYGYEGFDITAGRHHMDGATALKYARTRHADSDYGRAARQQQVIVAVKDKLRQSDAIGSLVPRIPGLAIALANSIQTDMPVDRALVLGRILDKADVRNPTRVVIDNSYGTQEPDNPDFGFILKVDPVRIRSAAAPIFNDAPILVSAEEELRQKLQAESARVVVLTSGRQSSLANPAATALSVAGFNVTAVGDAGDLATAHTMLVTYGDGNPVAREALLRRFNIPSDRIRFEPPSPDAELALVLGDDLTLASAGIAPAGVAVQAPPVGGANQASPVGGANQAPPVGGADQPAPGN